MVAIVAELCDAGKTAGRFRREYIFRRKSRCGFSDCAANHAGTLSFLAVEGERCGVNCSQLDTVCGRLSLSPLSLETEDGNLTNATVFSISQAEGMSLLPLSAVSYTIFL